MNKKEVQKRVLQNGKPLDLSKFSWDEKTNTFSSDESNLVIDFYNISYCTFNTSDNCTFNTGWNCIFNTDWNCIFNTSDNCIFNTDWNCIFKTGDNCIFKTGVNCTFKTGDNCTFNTSDNCTFNTGWNCIFNTDWNCIFKTGDNCIFKTSWNCIFKTGDNCTFNCIFYAYIINNNKNNVLILRYGNKKEIYDLDTFEKNKMIYFKENETPILKEIKETKLVDNQIVIVNSTKTFEDYQVYLAQDIKDYFKDNKKTFKVVSKEYNGRTYYAHCESAKKGIEDVNFKIARVNYNLSEIAKKIKEKENMINWYDYRLITGACEFGTKQWLEQNDYTTDDTMNIKDFYDKYKEERPYGFDKFEEFYKEWLENDR